MDFRFSEPSLALQEEMEAFFRTRVLPRNHECQAHVAKHGAAPPFLEELKREARAKGLWNLGLPDLKPEQPGTRLTNLEFAPLAAIMGRLPWAPIAFNCNAPNVPNMEILQKFGNAEQKRQWLDPLLDGQIWTAFGMTEPDVASSDARNIRTRIRRDGGDYVIDGRKWFISGAAHPDCKMVLVVGVTDPEGDAARRHSVVIVPRDTPGLEIVRGLPIFGRGEDAGGAPVELRLSGARVPRANLLGEEGAGFALGQARLGVARIHHCMRSLGSCDVLLQLMRERAANRKAFGRPIGDYANIQDYIALSRIEVEQAKLLVYKTAWLLDQGNADARREISMIKIAVARCYSAIADRAVQIFGAAGVSDDTPAAAAYTAARAMRIYDGPDEVHLRTLFRLEPHEVAGESRYYLRAG
jgi:acyl-CoA dehydrogenase